MEYLYSMLGSWTTAQNIWLLFLIGGFSVGFISKRYGQYIILLVLGGILTLYVGYYYNFLSVDTTVFDGCKETCVSFINTFNYHDFISSYHTFLMTIGFIVAFVFS